ncbi:MAG TPA: MarR family transcriptional regulator [Ktedonobacteraceae bacterium]|nr:MarR family transcriptional regulator [Ktedonobacteraceae bacterium]
MIKKSSSTDSPQQPIAATAALDALTVANRLRPVLLRLHRFLRGEAHELGVTSTQASLLAAIQRSPGIGLGELAAQEHMSAPTLVNHIDRLETAGFVERAKSNLQDRRRVDLNITTSGCQVLETLRERRTAWLATRLETLTPDELAAVAAAIEPLQQLVKRGE